MGNLDSLRDWGHARDYVTMQWLMLQQAQPEDFVIATGRQESVRRFIELTANQLGWGPIKWEGEGTSEVGRRSDTGAVVVRIDPRYFRPAEVDTLLGDPSKARETLGWSPTTTLEELVAEMVAADVEEAQKEACLMRRFFCSRNSGMSLIIPSDRFQPRNFRRTWYGAVVPSVVLSSALVTANNSNPVVLSLICLTLRLFRLGSANTSPMWLYSLQPRWEAFMRMPRTLLIFFLRISRSRLMSLRLPGDRG